jgi:hypothetical protein
VDHPPLECARRGARRPRRRRWGNKQAERRARENFSQLRRWTHVHTRGVAATVPHTRMLRIVLVVLYRTNVVIERAKDAKIHAARFSKSS